MGSDSAMLRTSVQCALQEVCAFPPLHSPITALKMIITCPRTYLLSLGKLMVMQLTVFYK